jgi:alanyl-tRNA synthetase
VQPLANLPAQFVAAMMTSTQVRQSFLDFFKSKQHTIVPSSSLMPDSPNLLFTNAGMNQFVPIFLGQTKCPYTPGRAADTQKCIRAGGKHNDLDDVGLDTYHHTFFEMLGNWSFGDYFKQEAIEWAWELVIEVWKFPPQRLYATVYNPDKSKGDPSEFDQDAWNFWAEKFRSVGLDPALHIVNGNKKDNFWMMGETGPCGPCSELHVDLTPAGDTKGALVNKGSAECIEIWNLVFIQFNANPDGTFSPLPAKHVDTGMGFERVTSIIQGTKNLTDFANAKISNYETDIFRPIFDAIEKLSGKKYGSTLPKPGSTGDTEQEKIDVAFRVIGDHIRTLSFSIADGIQPGIKGRNGVLRSIHKRMVRYAANLDVKDALLLKTQDALVDTIAATMGEVFPEIRREKDHIKNVLRGEADVFNRTLGSGLNVFETLLKLRSRISDAPTSAAFKNTRANLDKFRGLHIQDADLANTSWFAEDFNSITARYSFLPQDLREYSLLAYAEIAERIREAIRKFADFWHARMNAGVPKSEFLTRLDEMLRSIEHESQIVKATLPGEAAFLLYDTYGFPLDLTELMARERGLTVDKEGFNRLMEEQKKRSQAAQKKEVISLSQIETTTPTQFVGFEKLETTAKVVEVVSLKDKTAVILDTSACYAEMGGQVGDTGTIVVGDEVTSRPPTAPPEPDSLRRRLQITNTQKSGNTWLHFVEGDEIPATGDTVVLRVDKSRRDAIQRHHTVTHLLHWALHEVVSKEASQKGSFVGPDKLTFDFNSAPLTPAQVADIEKLVNERIVENAGVSWTEVPYADVKSRKDVMQFFGDKYGDTVRVVQIGGHAARLDGYSMELCGGTHTRATGEIGLFRIVGESAIAAGVRRIEAVAGLEAYRLANDQLRLLRTVAGHLNSPVAELEKKVESLLAHQKELERQLKTAIARNASNAASELLAHAATVNGIPFISHNLGDTDGDFLQAVVDALKGRFKGVIVLGGGSANSVALVAAVTPDFTAKVQAGKIIQTIAPIVGGKGGGKPDNARGGGKDASKLDEALAKAKSLLA